MNRLLSILSAMAVCLYMSAQRHVVINKNDVNLRSEASTTAQVVKKAKKGTVLELVESKPGWFKAKSYEGDGETVWVAASIAAKLEDWHYNDPYMTQQFVLPDSELGYESVAKFKDGETHDVWFISSNDPKYWESEAKIRPIVARNANTVIYNTGRMFTNDTFYKGKSYPTYFVLDEHSTDGGETWEKLETQIYIYPSFIANHESGIFVDGKFFEDQGNADF